jgi:hypothetical protein
MWRSSTTQPDNQATWQPGNLATWPLPSWSAWCTNPHTPLFSMVHSEFELSEQHHKNTRSASQRHRRGEIQITASTPLRTAVRLSPFTAGDRTSSLRRVPRSVPRRFDLFPRDVHHSTVRRRVPPTPLSARDHLGKG